jgi:hypothetical protein
MHYTGAESSKLDSEQLMLSRAEKSIAIKHVCLGEINILLSYSGGGGSRDGSFEKIDCAHLRLHVKRYADQTWCVVCASQCGTASFTVIVLQHVIHSDFIQLHSCLDQCGCASRLLVHEVFQQYKMYYIMLARSIHAITPLDSTISKMI